MKIVPKLSPDGNVRYWSVQFQQRHGLALIDIRFYEGNSADYVMFSGVPHASGEDENGDETIWADPKWKATPEEWTADVPTFHPVGESHPAPELPAWLTTEMRMAVLKDAQAAMASEEVKMRALGAERKCAREARIEKLLSKIRRAANELSRLDADSDEVRNALEQGLNQWGKS